MCLHEIKCHLCQHGISISGIKWTVSKEICRLSGTTHAHRHGNAGTLWVLLLSKLPFPSGQILGTSLPHRHQWASPGSLYLLSTSSLLFFSFFFFFASQLPLSKLDLCQRPSHAALVCIPLPVQPTVPEVDGFQVGANLHLHLGYSDQCSRPVMTPPTPAGIEINRDTQLIIETRERCLNMLRSAVITFVSYNWDQLQTYISFWNVSSARLQRGTCREQF